MKQVLACLLAGVLSCSFITSASAVVTIGIAAPMPPGCVTPPGGIVGWWPGDGNANDLTGNNNASLLGGVTYAPGEVGLAFDFTDTNEAVVAPGSTNLDVGAGSGFTLEAWINPTDVTQTHPIFEWNNLSYWGVHFHIAPGQPFNSSPGPGELYANVVDNYGGWHQLSSPGGVVVSNVFQHVALTYDQASGIATIYCNGQIVGQQNIGSITPRTSPAYALFIGARPAPAGETAGFAGLIDEPSVYSRALSSNEIAAIYLAGSAGKCTNELSLPFIITPPASQTVTEGGEADLSVVAGAGALRYQWFFNGNYIPGATSDELSLTNIHPSQAGNYTVEVSNSGGSVTSSPALVTVITHNILIYSYSGNEAATTLGSETADNYSGQLFFVPDTTNAVFVGWAKIDNIKQYWVTPVSDYLLIRIPGTANRSYTILGKAGSGYDINGQPHLWSSLHKGQDVNLVIGARKTISFPDTFVFNDTRVYPDEQTGNMVLREATSNYWFMKSDTVTANNRGETVADLVSAQVTSLVKQGYHLK